MLDIFNGMWSRFLVVSETGTHKYASTYRKTLIEHLALTSKQHQFFMLATMTYQELPFCYLTPVYQREQTVVLSIAAMQFYRFEFNVQQLKTVKKCDLKYGIITRGQLL